MFCPSGRRYTRVVDQDINEANLFLGRSEQAVEVGIDGDIGLNADRSYSLLFLEFRRDLLDPFVAPRGDRDVRARHRKRMRTLDAEPRRRSRHEADVPAQRKQRLHRFHHDA